MQAEQEPTSVLVETRLNVSDQLLTGCKQFIKANRCPGHTFELP